MMWGEKIANKYFEETVVKECMYDETEEICTEIIVEVKGIEVECFNVLRDDDFIPGRKYIATLNLKTFKVVKMPETVLDIKVIREWGSTCPCYLSGIIEFIDCSNQYGVVDCGMFVHVEFPSDNMFFIGDFIKAEGRLDIKKI